MARLRHKRVHPKLALLSLVCIFSALTCTQASSPLFQDLNTDKYVTIEDYKQPGTWLVVMIWAHDCEVCEREVGSYQNFHDQQDPRYANVLGLTLDGSEFREQANEFVTRHRLEFENIVGEPEVVAGYYELITGTRWVGTPSFLIFGPDGELMAKQVGAVEVDVVENFISANSQ